MTSPLLIINFINLAMSMLTGLSLQYVFKDMSKNSGFIITNKKQMMVVAHIFIGMIVGMLILPVRYKGEESGSVEVEGEKLPKSVLIRQSIGLVIFLVYTIRNFVKHPVNLKKNLDKCNMGDSYSLFKSSITRQQMQLLLGMSLSSIPALYIMKKTDEKITRTSGVFLAVSGLSLFQIFAQFYNEHDSGGDLKDKYLKCVG